MPWTTCSRRMEQTMSEESEELTPREEELALEGWSKKFTASEPKLTEYAKMYEELGFDVRLEAITPQDLGEGCNSCFMAACDLYRTIYTRPRKG